MVFSSFSFLFLFLPVVVLGYYLLSRAKHPDLQKLFLLGASLVFYASNNYRYLILLFISIAVNYILSSQIQKQQSVSVKKVFFLVGITFNLGLLGYYKYFNFFVENLSIITGIDFALKQIVLPLGISFFTFQQLSFLISIYHGEEQVESFLSYCLFVSFFPQLVAGPIVLYSELVPQFSDENRHFFCTDRFASAVYIFVIGLFKKAVIADTFSLFVTNGFGLENLGCISAWCVTLSYTLQLYFDFSGYSDMAVGLARMFNFEIPFNFTSPYRSESIREFWKRWHITLGRALSHYIYIPLGGNRKGLAHTCINLFLTFVVSGLWHGAAWTFVVWGALNGLLVVLERIFAKFLAKIPRIFRIGGTFILVNLLWVLFRAETFSQAIVHYRNLFNFGYSGLENLSTIATNGVINYPSLLDYGYVIGFLCAGLLVVFSKKNSKDKLESFQPTLANALTVVGMLFLTLVCLSRQSVFIYFNF